MTPPPTKRRRKTVVNFNVGTDMYDSDLTSRLRKFKALDADIKKLETYLMKAKNRRTFVRRSLEELGISGTMLDNKDDSGNLAVVSFSNVQQSENVQEPASDIIEIEPKEDMLSPKRVVSVEANQTKNVSVEFKQTKDDKPSKNFPKDVQETANFPKDVENNDVIVLSSSSDKGEGEDIGFNFDSGFDIQKVKSEPFDPEEHTKTKIGEGKMKDELRKGKKDTDERYKKKHKHKKKKDIVPENVCEKCNHSFSNKYNMLKHVKDNICTTPLENRPPKYTCRIENCEKRCHTKSAIRAHELGTHFNVQEHFCPEPNRGKAFTHPSTLINHKHSAHPDVYGRTPGAAAAAAAANRNTCSKHRKKKQHKVQRDEKKVPLFSSPDDD